MYQDWYVLTTTGKREHVAAGFLNQHNVYTIAPRIQQLRLYRSRKPDYNVVPLFPGYVFTQSEPDYLKQVIIAMRQRHIPNHIKGIVSIDTNPVPVENDFMLYLLTEGGPNHLIRYKQIIPECPYQPGDVVQFLSGSAEGKTATFLRMSSDERVILLVNLLGRNLEIPTALENISLRTSAH